jgi:hypothetical protein
VKTRESFPAATTARYPWDQILNGEVWEMAEGEDFTARPATVISNARVQAKRRGGSVRTRLLDEEGGKLIVLQFVHA